MRSCLSKRANSSKMGLDFDFCSTGSALFLDAPPEPIHDDEIDLDSYVEIVVFFSGGRDSVSCVLRLLELGVPASKIEIHHHLVDGNEGSTLMDWPVTLSYCKAFAKAFGMRFVTTWRSGGFEAEMCRQDSPTQAVMIPHEGSALAHRAIGGKGPLGTRQKFPQVSADQSVRWCSSYLKGDVGARYLTNTARFNDGQRRLIVTGERAEESPCRAKYAQFLPHVQDRRNGQKVNRFLDHWRPVHAWKESQIWGIIKEHGVNPHPAYKIGFSRCSCMSCIFVANDNWATIRYIAPERFQKIAEYERKFGVTIDRTRSVTQRADLGTVMQNADAYKAIAMSEHYSEPILVSDWKLPAGAYRVNAGSF